MLVALLAALMLVVTFLITGVGSRGSGMELTQATWDDATAGKTVFVKFLAPW